MTKYNLWINHDLKLDIAKNMETYGGSFVKALSKCLIVADHNNLLKLEETFKEYIEEYHPCNWEEVHI